MTENNKKQNSIYSMALSNKVIYFYLFPGGGIKSLFIKMMSVGLPRWHSG